MDRLDNNCAHFIEARLDFFQSEGWLALSARSVPSGIVL